MNHLKRYASLDSFRLAAAFLIVAIHTSPLISMSAIADFILTRIIARVAVPFFFMVTGYFIYSHIEKKDTRYIIGFCKKLGITYLISVILYLPLNWYAGYFKNITVYQIVKDIIFDGTFYHLWYLPAAVLGVLIITGLLYKLKICGVLLISFLLYLIGLGGDSYYGLVVKADAVKGFYDLLFKVSSYTRNGIFFAPMFLALGVWIGHSKKQISKKLSITGFTLSIILLFIEGMLLYSFKLQRHDSMYIGLIPCMYFLFQFLLLKNGKSKKSLRSISLIIYIIHPWMIVLIRGFGKAVNLEKILINNSLVHFLGVSISSFLFAWVMVLIQTKLKKNEPSKTGRAWAEINLDALKDNAKELQNSLPDGCKLMAIVKANAYGHGDIRIARTLENEGVKVFGVATLAEGVGLRKNGIKGDILILGFTNPKDIDCLIKYCLMQTVLNYEYADTLNRSGKKIRVHIKLDTGMHRLGEDYNHFEELEGIYKMKNIIVDGIFTHLSVADSLKEEDIIYSKMQIEHYFKTVSYLKSKGYNPGKLHYQSSYGILNYKEPRCDYARIGIALYGILSNSNKTKTTLNLQPVMSVKARIALVRELSRNESVSYGRTFTSPKDMKIAVITIGYADGIPRSLSGESGYILIHDKKAPILGRICMDQLIVDVTEIKEVKPNDIATIIGKDGEEEIRCEDFAERCGTITNEILSRLGNRLEYIYQMK
ncbi:serine/alanine racemase [Mobilisporobacter senegalensis]|uniref:Alanine racemase n=1 Tax=Mobilisporobacter senegalensis TaxID=1329262 RepID=A0A3N1XPW5_9FIRM|nr:serine racemase VanT catalytic subunit [Mobilisporobacter senegalensis]ROR28719.1 serine/alanine racemase [Mobilisporobacter senegalensis]